MDPSSSSVFNKNIAEINHIIEGKDNRLPHQASDKLGQYAKDMIAELKTKYDESTKSSVMKKNITVFGKPMENDVVATKYIEKMTNNALKVLNMCAEKIAPLKKSIDESNAELTEQKNVAYNKEYINKQQALIDEITADAIKGLNETIHPKSLPIDKIAGAIIRDDKKKDIHLSSNPPLGIGAHALAEQHMKKRIQYFEIALQQCANYSTDLKEEKWKVQDAFKADVTQKSAYTLAQQQQKGKKSESKLESAHISLIPLIPIKQLGSGGSSVTEKFNPNVDVSKEFPHIQEPLPLDAILNSTDLLPWYFNAIDGYSEERDREFAVELMNKVINKSMTVKEATKEMCVRINSTLKNLIPDLIKKAEAMKGQTASKSEKTHETAIDKLAKATRDEQPKVKDAIAGAQVALKEYYAKLQ